MKGNEDDVIVEYVDYSCINYNDEDVMLSFKSVLAILRRKRKENVDKAAKDSDCE